MMVCKKPMCNAIPQSSSNQRCSYSREVDLSTGSIGFIVITVGQPVKLLMSLPLRYGDIIPKGALLRA
jgi:hypothetical protein